MNEGKELEDKLSFKDIYDIHQDHIEKINWYINLYIATVTVLVGWLVLNKPRFLLAEKLTLLLLFMTFAIGNCYGILRYLDALSFVAREIKTRLEGEKGEQQVG